ncbi:ribonuclease HI family protein [Candidatus Gottesmanbacteria bacterium]|nr:ribonuclease HI family protein [Candidatus Gottesmanbacteria bacterium]
MTKKLIIFTDGGARGNPGPSGIGVVIKSETGQILNEISQIIGQTTNNVAEYQAVVAALEYLKNNYQSTISNYQFNFFLDSKLVVNQLNGLFKIKENHLRELMLKVRNLEQEVGGNISYSYIPREKNWEADALVNKALDGNISSQ